MSTWMIPGALPRAASFRLARPCTTAHASTAPSTASGVSSSAPEPTATHATFVTPAWFGSVSGLGPGSMRVVTDWVGVKAG